MNKLFLALAFSLPLLAQNGGLVSYPSPISGPELVQNAGFEDWSGPFNTPPPWTDVNTYWSQDTSVKHSGTSSAHFNTASMPAFTPQLVQTTSGLTAGLYTVSAWIKTSNLGSGGAGMRFSWQSYSNIISGTQDWTQTVLTNIEVGEGASIQFIIETYAGPTTGEVWVDDVSVTRQLYPVQPFMKYPNYRGVIFSDQSKTAVYDLTTTAVTGVVGDYTLTVTATDETAMTTFYTTSHTSVAHETINIDFSSANTAHTYAVNFSITGHSNTYTYPNYRVSFATASTRNGWNFTYDANNRFLIKGVPTFLIGVYDSGLDNETTAGAYATQWETYRRLSQIPYFNWYYNYWYGASDNSYQLPYYDALAAAPYNAGGLLSNNCFQNLSISQAAAYWYPSASDADVIARAAKPGFQGFYVADECVGSLAADTFTYRNRMVTLAPGTVMWGTLNVNTGSNLVAWRDTLDVIAQDPYPFYNNPPYDLSLVATQTQQALAATMGTKPTATVLQFFQGNSLAPWPNQAQTREMCYMAIAAGSNGCIWWSLGVNALAYICDGSDPDHSPSGSTSWCPAKVTQYSYLTNTVTEIQGLLTPLAAIDNTTTLTGNTEAGVLTRVKTVGGNTYIIASNTTNGTLNPTFTLNTSPTSISVYSESRSITPSANTFTDSFTAYDAHVYIVQFGGGSTITGKISGKVVVQ